jgi:hypothetical protein
MTPLLRTSDCMTEIPSAPDRPEGPVAAVPTQKEGGKKTPIGRAPGPDSRAAEKRFEIATSHSAPPVSGNLPHAGAVACPALTRLSAPTQSAFSSSPRSQPRYETKPRMSNMF